MRDTLHCKLKTIWLNWGSASPVEHCCQKPSDSMICAQVQWVVWEPMQWCFPLFQSRLLSHCLKIPSAMLCEPIYKVCTALL